MQSIFNKQHILEAFVDQHPTYQAICVSESWLSSEKIEMIQITNYKIAASFCRDSKMGGGVCILLQDHIEHIEEKDIANMSIEYVLETCAAVLPKENILLITIYWNRREEDLFYKQLEKILNYINKKYSKYEIVIGGDFNTDILKKNTKSCKLLDFMLEYGLKQYINSPTHISKTTSTCIDLIFSNNKNLQTSVEDFGFTYHLGTVVQITLHTLSKNNDIWYMKKRMFNNKNMNKFKSVLQNINWQYIIKTNQNINENYKALHDTLLCTLNQCIPKVKVKLKHHNKKHWLTVGIKRSCKNKRQLKMLINKSKSQNLIEHYKIYGKILKKSINISKKLHYVNRIEKSNNKIKTMWQIINERTNKKIINEKRNIKLIQNNKTISDPHQIAHTFNSFFASIGDNLNQQTCGSPVLNPSTNSMFLTQTDPQEIFKILKTLKTKKSHGIDQLPPILFKFCAEELALPLSLLINQSFEEGTFPNLLKRSIIKPIHKKNTKTDPNNYRPIALLPTASKIFEKAMYDRIYGFCEKFKIFHESQNGFRKNRSTTLAIYHYIQQAYNIINNKKYAIGLLLDMTKAYDTVQYNILLNKLDGIGIRGITHKWFTSYLKDREQLVEIQHYDEKSKEIVNIQSNIQIINASIPQGSVLGCLLFLIYINDLPHAIKEPCVMFADDISIITSCTDTKNLKEKLNNIVKETTNWMTEHNLQINFAKTKLMSFHPYQKTTIKINYSFNNLPLKEVNEFTLLGLNIDTNLNWKSHIKKIHKKLSSFSYALREVKRTTDLKTAMATYYAYANAWLSYGITLWGNSTDAPTLFTMQKKLIRIIVNIEPTDSCRPHFQKLNILTLPGLYIFEVCKFVHKHPEFYTKRRDIPVTYSLRHGDKLMLPDSYIKLHSSSPFAMSVKIYNKLPILFKQELNEKTFLKLLKQLLLQKSYYSVNEYLDDKL